LISTALITLHTTQQQFLTRKLSYRKDDRTMRPIYMSALKNFGSP